MTAPDPEGKRRGLPMGRALADAGISADDIDYVNLHGTGTELNDAMESRAVAQVFPRGVPASSTKALTGHTLSAMQRNSELGICWLALSRAMNPSLALPPQPWDGTPDPRFPDRHRRGRAMCGAAFPAA